MTRTLTDPDSDDILEWTEKVQDADGDSLTTTLELDAVDEGSGFTQKDQDHSNVSWLDYSTRENLLNDGTREVFFDITVDSTQLTIGNDYRFEITADDGIGTVSRKFILATAEETIYNRTRFYTNNSDLARLEEWEMDPADDLSSRTRLNTLGIEFDASIHFHPDGSFFIAFNNQNDIQKYTCSTPWDISTASLNKTVGLGDIPLKSTLSKDGEHLYYIRNSDDNIVQYDLSYPWDIGTLTQIQTVNWSDYISAGNPASGAFDIANDGQKMYLGDTNNNQITEHNLSTPYDLSTLSTPVNTFSYSGLYPYGLYMGSNGEIFYTIYPEGAIKHSCSTPFDLSTAQDEYDTGYLDYDYGYLKLGLGGP